MIVMDVVLEAGLMIVMDVALEGGLMIVYSTGSRLND